MTMLEATTWPSPLFTVSEGSVQLLDVDGDGKDDIIFASVTANKILLMLGDDNTTKYEGLHNRCKNIGKWKINQI